MLPDLAQGAARTVLLSRACAARTAGTSRLPGVTAAVTRADRAAPRRT
jgi:hypothetical protein